MNQPPALPADDGDTEPGIGVSVETVRLRRENKRLREERDAALERSSSVPPSPTRGQKVLRHTLTATQWTLVASAVGVVAPILAKKWPAYADLISLVLQSLGLQ